MSADPNGPPNPTPTPEQLAALLRENESLRRQLDEAHRERDAFKSFFLDEFGRSPSPLTAEDLAGAVPAGPFFDKLIKRLEKR